MHTYTVYFPLSLSACVTVTVDSASIVVPEQQKAKAHNIYISPQAAYCSCSGAFVSQTVRAYSL